MFFGNTLYLVALGYYTIICFLGYNGKPAVRPFNQNHRQLRPALSSTIPPPHRAPPLSLLRVCYSVVRQPLRLQRSEARGTSADNGGRVKWRCRLVILYKKRMRHLARAVWVDDSIDGQNLDCDSMSSIRVAKALRWGRERVLHSVSLGSHFNPLAGPLAAASTRTP